MSRKRTVYDSPWKQIIEAYFEEFLTFFFPAVHDEVDWSRSLEFLDKELAQLNPEAATGSRTVDKLVKVWWIDGASTGSGNASTADHTFRCEAGVGSLTLPAGV